MEIETSEQLAFIPEQVDSILMGVIDGTLKTEVYIEEKVSQNLHNSADVFLFSIE